MNLKPRFFNQRGITLVEVAVVLTVAGILATVAAPTISNALRRERARGFAHDVANQLREARNQAVSRGEAIAVYVGHSLNGGTPGRIKVWRTVKRTSSGNFDGGACDTETEGITTFDCADDAVCMGNTCQGQPARSCREVPNLPTVADTFTSGDVQFRAVVDNEFGDNAEGNMGIRLAWSGSGNFFCISPRGTIEQFGGQPITPFVPGSYSCTDEGFNIWVSDRDFATNWSAVAVHMQCASGAEDYERVRGHVIRLMPNGEISLRPPRKP